MAAVSRIQICNEALARLPAKEIQSVDENSLEARECRRFYPSVLSDMLAGEHDWSFATRRVLLAAVTNDRAMEWVYAYAVPSDMGSPKRVIPDLQAAGLGYPVPLPGDPYAETWAATGRYLETPYIIENGVLYTNTETATLEYGINDIEETNIGPLVRKALALQLAAELALPIKKDAKLRLAIQPEAEVALQRAMADDANRQPQVSGDYLSEAMVARHSGYIGGC